MCIRDSPGTGTSSYANAYLGANIFCGHGPANDPKPMYTPLVSVSASDDVIRKRVQGSSIPNAQVNNGVYTLGFK